MMDIKPTHFTIIKSVLKKHISADTQVFVFGSRAKNNARPYSDLDLLLRDNKPLSMQLLANLAFDFEESDLPYKVDLVDWMSISDTFKKTIEPACIALKF